MTSGRYMSPLGKLHSERWVPADVRIRQIVGRILTLRGTVTLNQPGRSSDWLLREPNGRRVCYQRMWQSLAGAAQRAGCSSPVRPHQLRHTFASEMVRLGIGLPALKELLGHSDIRMTMVYVQVTQNDLQREPSVINRLISANDGVQSECGILSSRDFLWEVKAPFLGFRSWQGQRDERDLQGHDTVYLTFAGAEQSGNRLGRG